MLVNSRIDTNTMEFEVQSNREDLTQEDKARLSEIITNAMEGDYEANEGFSVSLEGNNFGMYQHDIKSDEFGDDLHAAFENERELEVKAFEHEINQEFLSEQAALEELNKALDSELSNWGNEISEAFDEGVEESQSKRVQEFEQERER